ncbi:metallophosphoesterase [Corallococcus carmarthensis]|uniref:metallophosphoesterase n=1 Tax=Corallococcus carmarthensis TaxID=2316728 RepID=UPI00148DCCCB|nr:metallophosphoesterase [Corallococcus carmarthensis]NOK17096.1 metallophosphoesterase [Corallococcus carmarthensis]
MGGTEGGWYFAAVGDVHGQMHAMVRLVEGWSARTGKPLAFVVQVGDFEPHRDEADLATMAAPAKYKHLGDFPAYHRRQTGFPWPVYFIGGNHEPYGFLDAQAPQGLEVTPGCHYLGRVGQVEPRGLRVAGLSGIHREDVFRTARPSLLDPRSVSHKAFAYFNEEDVDRAMGLRNIDVLLLHDWPSGLIAASDAAAFAHQRRSVSHDTVGNDYARMLVEALRPRLVLCGHMHRAYRATIRHPSGQVSDVACLASVRQGLESLAVFHVSSDRLTEVTRTR